jgi:hypothetical protein
MKEYSERQKALNKLKKEFAKEKDDFDLEIIQNRQSHD